ncbi:MAG: nucleotidyl transferase AbiEii/AbiGii toxin family protein [Nitrospirota bacterium]
MRSIRDTLETIRDITNALPVKVTIVLTGGYAVIAHGVERTTLDLDFCVYSDIIETTNTAAFFDILKKNLSKRYEAELRQGSKIPDDPFKHDLIRIIDNQKEFLRIDLLIARYKWELEGMEQAVHLDDVPLPVLSKPYLVAMKLQATAYKDYQDVVSLFELMTEEEREKTRELAKRTHRDKKLARILSPPPEEEVKEMTEEYL